MVRFVIVIIACACSCGTAPSKDGNGENNDAGNSDNVSTTNSDPNSQNVTPNNVDGMLVELDDPCDGEEAFTGRAVLGWFDEEYSSTLSYVADEGVVPVELRFELGEEVRCFPHVSPPDGSLAPEQPPRIELEVMMEVRTDDGAFDELLPATVTANPFSSEAGVAFGGSIPSTSFRGTYPIDPQARYGFTGTAMPGMSNGTIQESVGNSVAPIARWPAQ